MKSLFVLHDQPRIGVQLLADVHLRPTLTAACKIIHTAAARLSPKDVTDDRNSDNLREFKYKGILIMPPYPGQNPWVDWTMKSMYNFWWIVETAWWSDKELQYRFHLDQSLMYLRLSKIIEEGVARHFPKPEMRHDVKGWPSAQNQLIVQDEISNHRQEYRLLKGKIRMKWTNREVPQFMTVDYAETCPECKGPKPITGVCDTGCFYGRN